MAYAHSCRNQRYLACVEQARIQRDARSSISESGGKMTKQQTTDKTTDVSRCKFLGAGTAVAATFGAITLNASEAQAQTFDS